MTTPMGKDAIRTIGGTHTHILLELSRENSGEALFYLGSALTVSYSVHRDKVPVFNCGSHLIDGFSIANKYVAGSLMTIMYNIDEFAELIKGISDGNNSHPYKTFSGIKESHTFMRDDLIPFNLHAIFTNEYSDDVRKIVIYDATFINNGQVMSINDIITENTLSFVARDMSEQGAVGAVNSSLITSQHVLKASSLL